MYDHLRRHEYHPLQLPWDKLKQSARVQNLEYKGWDGLFKFTLKSPRSMKLENWGMLKDVMKLDKVSIIELGEFGGRCYTKLEI